MSIPWNFLACLPTEKSHNLPHSLQSRNDVIENFASNLAFMQINLAQNFLDSRSLLRRNATTGVN